MAYNEDNTETIPNRENMYARTNGNQWRNVEAGYNIWSANKMKEP